MLQTLELTNFRSYKNGLFGFEPGVNIIVGPNASGKTNLLEALHVICCGNSFKASDKDMLKNGEKWARLEALTSDGTRVIKLQSEKQKLIEIDGESKYRMSPQKSLPVVVFEPEHMLLLGGEPERRRNYLDTLLSTIKPGYKQTLTSYKRALAQRNRLLKSNNPSPDTLFVWDVQLVDKAGAIVSARRELVEKLQLVCDSHYKKISSSKEKLSISYASKLTINNYGDQLMAYLRSNVEKDIQRGFTGAGPHRDDLYIELKNSDVRQTASRGEVRSIILALKIAELELVGQEAGKKPILLLDDVFSELDGARRRSLAEALQDYQTFITTTDADVVIDHFTNCNIIPMQQS